MENILLKRIMRLREDEMRNVKDEIVKGISIELDNILGKKLEYNEYATMVKERLENTERVNRQLNDIIESERRQMKDMKSNLVNMMLENKRLKKELEEVKNSNKELKEKYEGEQARHTLTSKILEKVEDERECLRTRYEDFRKKAYDYIRYIHDLRPGVDKVYIKDIKYYNMAPIPTLEDSKEFDIFGSHRLALIDSNGTGELFEFDIKFTAEDSRRVREGEIYKTIKETVLQLKEELKDYFKTEFSTNDICNDIETNVLDGRLIMDNIDRYFIYKYTTNNGPVVVDDYGFKKIFGEMPYGIFGFPANVLNDFDYSTPEGYDDGTL